MIEQSRQAFLEDQRNDVEDNGNTICSESEEELEVDLLLRLSDFLHPAARQALQKRIKSVRHKARREAAKKIAEKRFLKRKRSKRLGSIMKEYPDIGRTIE